MYRIRFIKWDLEPLREVSENIESLRETEMNEQETLKWPKSMQEASDMSEKVFENVSTYL